jgi:uncharacterized protein (TIGR03435 family)
MNTIGTLAAQPWVERLGATLLHFLWQGVAIGAVYAVARRRAASANARYQLACVALAAMAAAPVLTWSLLGAPADPAAIAGAAATPLAASATVSVRSVPTAFYAGLYRAAPSRTPLLSWVVAVWLAGVVGFWLRLAGGWIAAEQLLSMRVRPAPPEWQQRLDCLKARLGISRPVRLLVSALVQAPSVVGWLRPMVLAPVGALAGLPAGQMEALLFHELAHIRRHDYLVNALESVVEAMLFYHPAVWWISGHIRTERELCCDDVAVALHGDAVSYARALAELEAARPERFGAALAASGGSLAHRVGRLLGYPRPMPGTRLGPGILAAAVLMAAAGLVVFGQPARPKFEVASIKPSQETRFQMVRPQGGRLTASASLRILLQNAYSVQPFQIVGGPDWIDSERYQIEAKTDAGASHSQIFLMLQSLLEERCHLQVHRDTRELPVYALVAARNGPRLSPPKEGSCLDAAGDVPQSPTRIVRMPVPGQGPTMFQCGRVGVALEIGGARMAGGKVIMAEFVRMLSGVMGRPLVDRTGFTGLFDVQLDFQGDEATAGLPPPPPNSSAATDSRFPTITVALQEQLGLRLESTKGPVDVLVIDHVERPSQN